MIFRDENEVEKTLKGIKRVRGRDTYLLQGAKYRVCGSQKAS